MHFARFQEEAPPHPHPCSELPQQPPKHCKIDFKITSFAVKALKGLLQLCKKGGSLNSQIVAPKTRLWNRCLKPTLTEWPLIQTEASLIYFVSHIVAMVLFVHPSIHPSSTGQDLDLDLQLVPYLHLHMKRDDAKEKKMHDRIHGWFRSHLQKQYYLQ